MLSTSTSRGNRALLIGINQYPMLVGYDLRGCVNDVLAARDLLSRRADFSDSNITLLRDHEATRQNILDALNSLISATERDDQVLVYYAGHGSQARDATGGVFETIVPHDSGRGRNPNRDISDVELGDWLRQLAEKTPYITLVFDCCHSGTLTRELYGDTARWVVPDMKRDSLPGMTPKGAARVTLVPPSDRYVIISACRDEEKAYELSDEADPSGRVAHGTLSYYLLRALFAGHPKDSWRDLFERVAAQVNRAQPRQHPRCEGALDRIVMGRALRPPPRYVLISAADSGVLRLDAGAVHGVVAGSEWEIQSTVAVGENPPPARRASVELVGALTSLAKLADTGPLGLPARAIETLRPEGDREPRWPIQVQSQVQGEDVAMTKLLTQLALSLLMRPVGPDEPSRLRLSLEEKSWTVLGRDGMPRLVWPRKTPGEDDAAAICDGLERLVRHERLRLLSRDESPLCGKLVVGLQRSAGPKTWEPVPQRDGASLATAGDRVVLDLRSLATERLYVTVLWLGMGLAIHQLWPPNGAQLVEPGAQLRVGDWQMSLPRNPAVPLNAKDPAVDLLKIFVTRREFDFSPLLQGGVRGTSSESGSLSRLLQQALYGKQARALLPPHHDDEEWAAELHQVLVYPVKS